ncbi:MAG: hypothetical protein HZA24_00285 [Nitrospirae bacterium]|nr:hypothetical protein [Nitrospirota bacterium]
MSSFDPVAMRVGMAWQGGARSAVALLAMGMMFVGGVIALAWPEQAGATAQWSRKYQVPCGTCHTVFPRLNPYGERFMRNGYQNPDAESPDGDEKKRRIGQNLVLDDVSNLLGFRLSLTPLKVQENGTTVAGDKRSQLTIGDANWIQFFVAGSIFKDVSFFTEMEFEDDAFGFTWWKLGFHNLGGTTAANVTMGNVSPIEFSSHSNRLRIVVPVSNAVYAVRTANGSGDDDLSVSGSLPGIQYYGYKGPAIWWAGVSPGSSSADVNDSRYYWAGGRLEVSEAQASPFEGSNVSLWAMTGEDGNDTAAPTTVNRTSNTTRYQVAGNLRHGALDVQGSYVWGEDDDGNLATAAQDKFEFDGVAFQAAYRLTDRWYPAISYDNVSKQLAGVALEDVRTITPSISYLPRDNMRLGLYATLDLNNDTGHDGTSSLLINLRTMF